MAVKWQLSDTLEAVACLSRRELQALQTAGLTTVGDVLMKAPKRYEDRRTSASLTSLADGEMACLRVHLYGTGWRFSYKRYFEALVGEEGDVCGPRLFLRWFNMPYVARILATGMNLSIYGRVKLYGGKLTMTNPDFEVMEEEEPARRLVLAAMGGLPVPGWEETGAEEKGAEAKESEAKKSEAKAPSREVFIHTGRIVPVYRGVSGMSARNYRFLVWQLLENLAPDAAFPGYDVARGYPFAEALRDLHFPAQMEKSRKARLRFALAECCASQFRVAWRRHRMREQTGHVTVSTEGYVEELLASLPFELTGAQKRCIAEIRADMASPRQMNRLLQGDVGSGKTLVALCAMLLAVESGWTAALIAPTQILAEQHYNNFRRLLRGMDVRLSLRTSDKSDDTGLVLESPQEDDGPRLLVGTHALLYRKNRPHHLGLAVIDEQHKFGVEQRERFISSGDHPDVLVMTATPIPRTLTLTLYGDLDVSVMDELPARRGEIVTALRHPAHMKRIISFMRSELAAGRQIYIVSPLVEDSQTRSRTSATSELNRWREIFPEEPIGLLHGRLSAEEKDAVMAAFRANETHLLVATTVVEVGVDVPNATVMLINDADTFGLSQLHQLRGRIGRGEFRSYCILLSSARPGEPGREKLEVLCRTLNGFDIAEEDFRLRGPGDVLGTAQSGLGTVVFPEWLTDARLIHRANREAAAILEQDPLLQHPDHALLRRMVEGEENEAVTG